ncbi:transcriptional regulator, MarR family with acetyltransferase activity [Lunatimonas lonarensis]|uniref:Transcriptional regulator, MarR family with acetyltransferase activity n=1 Tax=Lunatimonas lonarensis TaxID=1232681 RepID=R7ZU43_9BACT|nr:GNAT family N-acetyltransferase [Lunatimonas lonarensis]EON77671.1 transcriptional regulator, MarR family with acetyltransferase activity [Lunatimonas lonarensis]
MSSSSCLSDIGIRRHLLPGDIGAVVRLHGKLYYEEFGFGLGFERYVAETFSDFVKHFKPGLDQVWLAEQGGELVGFISLVHRSPDQAQLRYFVVDPSVRGLGLGNLLFFSCLEHGRRAGYRAVYLWTSDKLTQAASMYRKAGFELVLEESSDSFGVLLREQKYELIL